MPLTFPDFHDKCCRSRPSDSKTTLMLLDSYLLSPKNVPEMMIHILRPNYFGVQICFLLNVSGSAFRKGWSFYILLGKKLLTKRISWALKCKHFSNFWTIIQKILHSRVFEKKKHENAQNDNNLDHPKNKNIQRK